MSNMEILSFVMVSNEELCCTTLILIFFYCSFLLQLFTISSEYDQTLNFRSPYYLHLGESPIIALISPVLGPTNYNSWIRSMLTTLNANNKVEFIDGSLLQPMMNDSLFPAWRRCNNMVVSWFVHSISISIR